MKKFLSLAALLAFGLPVSVGAVPILDQENFGNLTLSQGIGSVPGSFGNPVTAQTFTVGIAGTLAAVDVFINNQSSGSITGTDLVAEIFGIAAGVPAGGALASTTINEALIPGGFGFFNIDFSSFGLNVSIGQQLAIVLRESSNNPNTVYSWAGSNSDSYAGGMRTFDIGSGFVNTTTDFYFRTFVESVEVSEPPTLLLMGLALAAAGFVRGRRPFMRKLSARK